MFIIRILVADVLDEYPEEWKEVSRKETKAAAEAEVGWWEVRGWTARFEET